MWVVECCAYNSERLITNKKYMISLLISLVIWGLIFYVLWWGLAKVGLPEPWDKIITVVLVLATVIVIIGLLQGSIAPFAVASLR